MREQPPESLVELLERLSLATAAEVRGMSRRVGRLARDLPLFESVWVDALAQARILTQYQAAEINAGRGESLRLGPYVLKRPLPSPGYVTCYRAGHVESRRVVRLAVIESPGGRTAQILEKLEALVAASKTLHSECLAPLEEAGLQGQRAWAVCRDCEGRTAAEWMVHNGRFGPQVVLEVARQMLAGLVALEQAQLCHGDVGALGLVLVDGGRIVLPPAGIRGVVRPEEGNAHADLLPEDYDYLAPERITAGTPPTTASDVYACGCLWWHMLSGRPPVSGGSSLAKLRAAQTTEIIDVRRFAPDVPAVLSAAVSACVQREPSRRPESMGRLAAMLGSSTRAGRFELAQCLARGGQRPPRWAVSVRSIRDSQQTPLWLAAAAGCLVGAVAIGWSLWHGGLPIPAARIPADNMATKNRQTVVPQATEEQEESAVYQAPDARRRGAAEANRPNASADDDGDLVLGTDGPLVIESLDVRTGQCVRGPPGSRPLVMVPPAGLVVSAENVRFENIDFVWNHGAPEPAAAVLHLHASKTEFRGCSFVSKGDPTVRPVAIRWTHPVEPGRWELSLPSGQVQLSDCVSSGVAAGVDCRTVGAVVVKLANTLHLGGGPLVRLDHCPKPDEPILIEMSHVTLRGAVALLECRYRRIGDQPARISIRSDGCAFVPDEQTAILVFAGADSPERLLENVHWTGQGSLVSQRAVIAGWHRPDGGLSKLDDASASIAGIVRSEVEFAGLSGEGPAASRITRWQVPLRSDRPPGIRPEALALPEL